MKTTSEKITSYKINGFGIYQIAGGMAGFGITIWYFAQTVIITGLILLLYFLAFGLYAYSIYCGMLLLKKKQNGLFHSSINQYLQLANFAVLGYGFKYVSGLLLSLGIDLSSSFEMTFNFGIMSTWEMNINNQHERIEINLNLVALFAILFIDKLRIKTSPANIQQTEIVE